MIDRSINQDNQD